MNPRRLAAALAIALLGPLPLPHVDTYLPLALGLYAAAVGTKENGPVYLALMSALFLVYGAFSYGLLSLVAHTRARRKAAAPR